MAWLNFIDARIAEGYRLVMAEEHLYEFGQSRALESALDLVQQSIARHPLWVRSFIDIEADEVCRFARDAMTGSASSPVRPFLERFEDISQISEKHQLDPVAFVRFAFDRRTVNELQDIGTKHASVLNELSQSVANGEFTKEHNHQALRVALRGRLSRGSPLVEPLPAADVDNAVKFCFQHHKRLMAACPAYATEHHLADYRTSSAKRRARRSDSMDLRLAVGPFPYVTTFLTNDGYLNDGLAYVKRRQPTIATELLRNPPSSAGHG